MYTRHDDPAYQQKFVVPHRILEHRSYKICLYGEGAVGKSCLIRRYVDNTFDEKYLMTIGTNISKKKIVLPHPSQNDAGVEITLQIWDIMGQMGFSDLLKKKHFTGASGAIGVCDITRTSTLRDLNYWTESLQEEVGKIPIIMLANKCDLVNQLAFGEKELVQLAHKYGAVHGFTSAKTGENVDTLFRLLSSAILMLGNK